MIIRFPKPKKETLFLDHALYIIIGLVAFIFLAYFFFDIPVAQYFKVNSKATEALAQKWTDLIAPQYHYLIWPVLYFCFKYGIKNEKWAQRFLIATFSIIFAIVATEILKMLTGRARPWLLFSSNLYGFFFFKTSLDYTSFPSGHSSNIGALCGAFACFYPRFSIPLALVAFALAFTRIILGMHYLSDAVTGVIIGLIISQWVYQVMTVKKTGEKWKTLFKMK